MRSGCKAKATEIGLCFMSAASKTNASWSACGASRAATAVIGTASLNFGESGYMTDGFCILAKMVGLKLPLPTLSRSLKECWLCFFVKLFKLFY